MFSNFDQKKDRLVNAVILVYHSFRWNQPHFWVNWQEVRRTLKEGVKCKSRLNSNSNIRFKMPPFFPTSTSITEPFFLLMASLTIQQAQQHAETWGGGGSDGDLTNKANRRVRDRRAPCFSGQIGQEAHGTNLGPISRAGPEVGRTRSTYRAQDTSRTAGGNIAPTKRNISPAFEWGNLDYWWI